MNKRPIDNLFSYGEVSTGFGTIEAELNLSSSGIHKKDLKDPTLYLKLFQDLAEEHSGQVGFPTSWFAVQNIGWIITRWHMDIHTFPSMCSTLVLKSWTAPNKRIQAFRSFTIGSREQPSMITACSNWLLLNQEKRRPARLPRTLVESYGISPETHDEEELLKPVQTPSAANFLDKTSFKPTEKDIDTNSHLNNLVYAYHSLSLAENHVPKNFSVKTLDIKYLKESRGDSEIDLFIYFSHSESKSKKKYIVTLNNSLNGELLAQVELSYAVLSTSVK